MKTGIIALLAIASLNLFASPPHGAMTFKTDIEKSQVTWNARKVTGEHTGTVKIKSGTFKVDHHMLSGGEFLMDMKSISVTDVKDENMNGKLVNHLKSDDFFGVEKFPEAMLKVKSFTPVVGAKSGEPNYKVNGDLTIKGITKPIVFPARISVSDAEINAQADITIDRTEFDVRFRSAKFFDSLGDKLIYDEFTLKVNLVAKPQ